VHRTLKIFHAFPAAVRKRGLKLSEESLSVPGFKLHLRFLATALAVLFFHPPTPPPVQARPARAPEVASSATAARNLRVFQEAWTLVGRKYYDPTFRGVNWMTQKSAFREQAANAPDERALYRVINQMLGALKDQHTFAIPPSIVLEEKRRARVGVGFSLRKVENRWLVNHVIGGSAAHEVGVKPGWILLEWDGQAFDGTPPGRRDLNAGQAVRLKFLDPNDNVKRIDIVCRPFGLADERRAQTLQNNVLYLRFAEFAPDTAGWVAAQLERNRRARGVVFDLRDNGGGLLNVLSDCLQLIYARDVAFGEFVQRNQRQVRMRINGGGRAAFAGPVVVLVDERSASAAEIFAAAIKETERGTVVGRPTAGAVLASVEERLPDGGKLQISIRDYRTQHGVRLEGRGVEPNVPVPLSLDDIRRNTDRDLDAALSLLQ
jgi:carboxyl-terminal processing protease